MLMGSIDVTKKPNVLFKKRGKKLTRTTERIQDVVKPSKGDMELSSKKIKDGERKSKKLKGTL